MVIAANPKKREAVTSVAHPDPTVIVSRLAITIGASREEQRPTSPTNRLYEYPPSSTDVRVLPWL